MSGIIGGDPLPEDDGTAGMFDPAAPADPNAKMIPREPPKPDPQRLHLVQHVQNDVRKSRDHWKPVFDAMRSDMSFALGAQWPGVSPWNLRNDDRYVANIVLRHVQQRTATLYAKNPQAVARVRKRLMNSVWDGSLASIQSAMQSLMVNPMDPNAQAIISDAIQSKAKQQLLERMGQTLEIVYDYSLDEQAFPFKQGMKMTVRRAVVTGVGYVKMGFQRVTTREPSQTRPVADMLERMDTAERLASDIADGETPTDSGDVENLRLTTQALAQEREIIVREGLIFDYPDSDAIIPDINCRELRNFLGCKRVTEQFLMTPAQVQEIYGVDVSKQFTAYRRHGPNADSNAGRPDETLTAEDGGLACVWETYDRTTGLIYVTCDGYDDFLREPAAPDVKTERFWPWFGYVLNETYHHDTPYPVSDVALLRDMQLEINRARQGLREHRVANRPKTIAAAGALDDEDKHKMQNHPANALIELNGLQPGQDVKSLLQPWTGPGIDPNLYETNSAMEDVMRTIGMQEANLGGTSGSTATETSIAEASRVSSVDAAMDDMDEMLTQMARTGSQILLLNVSIETAQKIAGPGAVWPQASALEAAEELYLEIEAGSSGRPNQAREIQNMQQMATLLTTIPGINPEWLARQMVQRLDDRARLEDALASGMPSVQAMNQALAKAAAGGMGNAMGAPGAQPGAPAPPGDPNAQGGQGGDNAPRMPGQGGTGPRPPAPRPAGVGPAAAGGGPMVN